MRNLRIPQVFTLILDYSFRPCGIQICEVGIHLKPVCHDLGQGAPCTNVDG